MTDVSAPLAELLRVLAPPLEYLAADDFRRLEHTRLPLPTLAERVRQARAAPPPAARAPLAELEEIVDRLRAGDASEPLLRRAHALVGVLREAEAGPAAWDEYRTTRQPVEPALAAVAQGVDVLRGVGPKRAEELARFGLRTVEDVLYHLPFRYEDRRALRPLSALAPGDEATVIGEVARVHEARAGRRGRPVLEAVLRDESGLLVLVWFHQIAWFRRRLREGSGFWFTGRSRRRSLAARDA